MSQKIINIAAFLAITLSVLGCKEKEPVLPPDIKLNPHPFDRYRSVLTIEGLSGPFSVTGEATFGIKNAGYCVPIDSRRSLGGSRPVFRKEISIPVHSVSGNVYEAIFYADSIVNEDYYGKTICEWSGSPAYRIHTPGTTYVVSVDTRKVGISRTKFCQIRPSRRIMSCINEELMGDANRSGYFSVLTDYYKE